jgi:hypothetical protein
MPIVVMLDQRASRRGEDLVEEKARELNESPEIDLRLPFVRTAGDEMQGVVATGAALAAVASRCLETRRWWVGVGFGAIDLPLASTARETRGPAFWNARDALGRAHQSKGGSPGPIAVVGDDKAVADDLEAALSAIAFIVSRRTARQREALAVMRLAWGLRWVAERLDISVSAASQLVRASGFEEQRRLEALVARRAAGVA